MGTSYDVHLTPNLEHFSTLDIQLFINALHVLANGTTLVVLCHSQLSLVDSILLHQLFLV